MAEREPVIVIKKITVQAAGHHGGSWKVAFADFMTALMAFFLVMWLVGQSEEVKKNVADHFSTPSIIEYNFSNYGVELTLEKLFLDLINEPLKFFQQFITPVDKTPNIMAMGSKKIVMHHIADQLGDVAESVQIYGNSIDFEIEAHKLFFPGTARPNSQFVSIMGHVQEITRGLEDSNLFLHSLAYNEAMDDGKSSTATNVAEERLDLIYRKIEVGLENDSVDIFGKASAKAFNRAQNQGTTPVGKISFRIKQKEMLADGTKPRPLEEMFGEKDQNMDVYQNFVKQLTESKTKNKKSKKQ
ncbi:MAG: chemotaxis protein MotB [Bdellovibrionaceae bacterium]|nr:chemotaxis protein MotB [Pseudobdellovibrionaceae bacterium]|tara:strand:+ start:118605 stop:119504 length:900 start_codon:yes stop_codon:yes gene_type:complete